MPDGTRVAPIAALLVLISTSAFADERACDRIRDADVKTGSMNGKMKSTGYDFAKDTPGIYGPGMHTCNYLRDEFVDSQATAVYREQYRSKIGTTDALIWISKDSGRLLREEEDGDIVGKGKGHIAYRWSSTKR